MATVGVIINYFVLLPFYVKAFGMPLDSIIEAGAAINSFVSNKLTFVIICVAPFNILKGFIDGLITALIYKRISILIRSIGNKK